MVAKEKHLEGKMTPNIDGAWERTEHCAPGLRVSLYSHEASTE